MVATVSQILKSATFTRASAATMPDGSQVGVNQPRFIPGKFGNGILIESDTTNILGQKTDLKTGWIAYQGAVPTITPEQTDPVAGKQGIRLQIAGGSNQIKYYCPVEAPSIANQLYSFSFWIRSRSGKAIVSSNSDGQSVTSSSNSWTFFSIVSKGNGTANAQINIKAETTNSDIDIDVAFFQVEKKDYPTSFTPDSRKRDDLTVPTAGVLSDAGPWTIECWAKANNPSTNTRMIFSSWNKFYVAVINTTPRLSWRDKDGVQQTVSGKTFSDPGGWHYWALTFDGNIATVYVDGVVVIAQTTNFPTPMANIIQIGDLNLGSRYPIDGIIDDFRVSSRARTADEILAAYKSGTRLSIDRDTTYKLDFEIPWEPVKTDWTASDSYNFYDLDRVENNILYLSELISKFGTLPAINTVLTRDLKRIEFADSMNRIEGNEDILRQRRTPEGWTYNKLDWKSNDPFSYQDAARLEKNLSLLYFYYLLNSSSWPYCGAYSCGEDVV